jgi:molybdopterin/thiamine biosynthesis adenylyltransferase
MIDYWRQLDIVTPAELDVDITIIGVGGLGSPIALALVKMGCPRLTLYDADSVEPHNLPNQLYRLADIGRPKVEALASLLREYAPVDVRPVAEMVTDQPQRGIVISAVDSMAARNDVWHSTIRYRAPVALYIDARMGGEVGRVLTVTPTNPLEIERYEQTLFTDEDGVEDPCTAQATIYSTFSVAALVANQIKRHVRAEPASSDLIVDMATATLIAADDTSQAGFGA